MGPVGQAADALLDEEPVTARHEAQHTFPERHVPVPTRHARPIHSRTQGRVDSIAKRHRFRVSSVSPVRPFHGDFDETLVIAGHST